MKIQLMKADLELRLDYHIARGILLFIGAAKIAHLTHVRDVIHQSQTVEEIHAAINEMFPGGLRIDLKQKEAEWLETLNRMEMRR